MSLPSRAPHALGPDLSVMPGHLIRRVQRVHGVLWARLVGGELTGPQFAVLSSIAARPGVDQATVGEEASLDKSTTVGIVRRLVRDGWVTTSVDPDDRRRKVLDLTPPARAALRGLTAQVRDVQEALLSPLPARERERLVADLAALAYEGRQARSGGGPSEVGLESAVTIGHLIRRAQHVHNAAWAERFEGALTGPQYAVLVALAGLGRADQASVGAAAALDKSSLSEVVERLVAKGLVAVTADDGDRRRKQLSLTPAAAQALPGMTRTAESVQAALLAHLPTPARRTALVRALAAVAQGHPL